LSPSVQLLCNRNSAGPSTADKAVKESLPVTQESAGPGYLAPVCNTYFPVAAYGLCRPNMSSNLL